MQRRKHVALLCSVACSMCLHSWALAEDIGYFDDDSADIDDGFDDEPAPKLQAPPPKPKAKYTVKDPGADHRSEGIKRSEANQHKKAVKSFLAALKFTPSADSLGNLGVSLMRFGNNLPADEARPLYFEALQLFKRADTNGNGASDDNIASIHQNCNIRWKAKCKDVFAGLEGYRASDFEDSGDPDFDSDFPEVDASQADESDYDSDFPEPAASQVDDTDYGRVPEDDEEF